MHRCKNFEKVPISASRIHGDKEDIRAFHCCSEHIYLLLQNKEPNLTMKNLQLHHREGRKQRDHKRKLQAHAKKKSKLILFFNLNVIKIKRCQISNCLLTQQAVLGNFMETYFILPKQERRGNNISMLPETWKLLGSVWQRHSVASKEGGINVQYFGRCQDKYILDFLSFSMFGKKEIVF